ERYQDRAGQGRQVDHEFRLELPGDVPEHIGQYETPFRIGVDDLDGLTGHRGDDIAGTLRIAVRHVLDQADGADGIHFRLPGGERMHQADHAGRPAHVTL